jgi:DNA polymerase
MRACIRADEGHKLVSVDASQIEARVLAWAAGERDLLEAFAGDRDIYLEFTASVLNVDVRKPRDGDDDVTRARLKAYRNNGKEAVLGLGYAMGA